MGKWLARECAISDPKRNAFVEVGHTDFTGLVPGCEDDILHGDLYYTVSLCGRFLLVAHGMVVHIYELNHTCSPARSQWTFPWQSRGNMKLGILRPVTKVICPRQVLACSMDTSAGRYAVAVLMEGRLGMVCDIMAERIGTSKPTSINTSHETSGPSTPGSISRISTSCICQENPVTQSPPIEEGTRSIYRSVGHSDDPPRSVALCPQRSCVAFGCSYGIELH